MRRAILVFSLAVLMSACQQPAAAPAASEPPAATPAPQMPADAPPQEEVDAKAAATPVAETDSCILDQGSDAAVRLAVRCTAVSPASHPPCNPHNPCKMIQDEIDRSCEMIPAGQARPAECAA